MGYRITPTTQLVMENLPAGGMHPPTILAYELQTETYKKKLNYWSPKVRKSSTRITSRAIPVKSTTYKPNWLFRTSLYFLYFAGLAPSQKHGIGSLFDPNRDIALWA